MLHRIRLFRPAVASLVLCVAPGVLAGCTCGSDDETTPATTKPTILEAASSGSVEGRVATRDGLPVPPGTAVSAQRAGTEVATAAVDEATGRFALGPVEAGAVDLLVLAPGHTLLAWRGVQVPADATGVAPDAILVPSPVRDLTGEVAATSVPLASVVVELRWDGHLVARSSVHPTTGGFGFAGVPVGDYEVTASSGASSVTTRVAVETGPAPGVRLVLP